MKPLPQIKRDKVNFARDSDSAEESKTDHRQVPRDVGRAHQKAAKFVNKVQRPKTLAKTIADLPDYPIESKVLFPENCIMTIEEDTLYDGTLNGDLLYGFKKRETLQGWHWNADNFQMPIMPPGDIAVFRSATDELFDIIETNTDRYSEEMQLELPRSETEFIATNAYYTDKIHRTLTHFTKLPE